MQASDQFHCSFVTLNSYIKSPQKFVLCYLSVACSQFLALLLLFSFQGAYNLIKDYGGLKWTRTTDLTLIRRAL